MKQGKQNHYNGSAAEYRAAAWFLENGYMVWWPSVHQDAADFMVSKSGKYRRIQVKKAAWSRRHRGSRRYYLQVVINRGTEGRRVYSAKDIDYVMAVDGERLWLIPFKSIRAARSLMLDKKGPAQLNQPTRLRYDPSEWRVV